MNEERRAPHPLLVELHGSMKVIQDRQETMYERLFGNGQPGELHHIRSKIESVEKLTDQKIDAVKSIANEAKQATNQWKWWIAGSSATIGAAWLVAREFIK